MSTCALSPQEKSYQKNKDAWHLSTITQTILLFGKAGGGDFNVFLMYYFHFVIKYRVPLLLVSLSVCIYSRHVSTTTSDWAKTLILIVDAWQL